MISATRGVSMQDDFCGKWLDSDETIEIYNTGKTFKCSLTNENIGIPFRNSLLIAEFDHAAQGGIGVYSPVGDGSSLVALWSSSNIVGRLGTGIALKSVGSAVIEGDYFVRYFVGAQETKSFVVKIESNHSNEIYSLSWYKEDQKILHGVGTLLGDSLVFAWGSIDFKYHLHFLQICKNDTLNMHTVTWGATEVNGKNFIKASRTAF